MFLTPNEIFHNRYGYDGIYYDVHIMNGEEDLVVGHVGVFMHLNRNAVDVFIDSTHRGKGYMAESYNLLIKELKIKTLWAYIKTDNVSSLKAHKKLGFEFVEACEDNITMLYKKDYNEIP